MSGGNSSKQKARSSKKVEGWEEAGGEFYQEQYPGSEQDLFADLQRADATKLHTLLPSKQARNNNTTTIKRVRSQSERRQSTFARTTQSRDIHLSMLPDLSENLSNEERTWEEIMQIKAMPLTMMQKRELKDRLQNATKLRLQGFEQLQWKQRKIWHRFRIRLNETITKLELWQGSLKKIEGIFGTGVVTYFLFLRWLLFLNLFISLLIILFLILPNVLLVESRVDCSNVSFNLSECCAQAYFDKEYPESNKFLDFLQGTGFMERTILFYGVYSKDVFTLYIKDVTDFFYDMPLAYILVAMSWALLSLVFIVKSAAKGFKERLLESEGQFYLYCNLVFGGWDFCIHNEKSAKIKHKALFNEIRASLEAERFKEEKEKRTRERIFYLYFKRILVNIFVLVVLLACAVLIYVTFNFSIDKLNQGTNDRANERRNGLSRLESVLNSNAQLTKTITKRTEDLVKENFEISTLNDTKSEKLIFRFDREEINILEELEILLWEFLTSITIVVLNIVIPILFSHLITFESYTPAYTIIISLLRTVLLRLSSLAVLLSQIYQNVTAPNRNVCSLNTGSSITECWETYTGQQFYKLILTDFAVQIIMTFFINLPRSFIAKHVRSNCLKVLGEQEFYLPKHVLDVVYVQTLIWMGAFFCPFLPIIGTIFYFVMFYIKKFTCLVNCTPSARVYKASKSQNLFMSVLFLGFVISILPVAFSIAEIQPSINCGPYRGFNTVWNYVVYTFEKLPYLVREAVFFLGTSTFAIPAFALLLFLLYYYWAVASANRQMVGVLKNQLVLEGHDKQFLLNRLSAFIRQHQRKCDRKKRSSYGDDESNSVRLSSR